MQPHLRHELERFRPWLGHWRGPGEIADKRAVMIEIAFAPLFDGAALQVSSAAFDIRSGECISAGTGFWGVDAQGKLAASIISAGTGALLMREVPEDPPGVCIEGVIGGSVRFTVALVPDGPTLTLTTRRSEGYAGVAQPVSYAVMRRTQAQGGR